MEPGSLYAWFWATRPWTLLTSGGAALVGMGCAVYDGYFSLPRFVMAILGAMIFQAGTNLINDYYDWKSGVDTFDLLSPEAYGPSLAIQRELLTPDQVWWAASHVSRQVRSSACLRSPFHCCLPGLAATSRNIRPRLFVPPNFCPYL